MKKTLLILTLGVLALFLVSGCAQTTTIPQDMTDDTMDEIVIEDPIMEDPVVDDDVKTFVITADNFNFYHGGEVAPDLYVNVGDTVRIEFVNEEGMHDWVLDEFNAATAIIQGGETDVIEFVADQAGTFEFYCSVMQHRAMGMVGNLIVE